VTIALQREAFRGQLVVAPLPLLQARLFFVSPAGAVAEIVQVAEDGSFTCARPHAAPEYAVLASRQPLAVLELPAATAERLVLTVPKAPVRNIEIRSDPAGARRDAVVRLLVGGRYVPPFALARHQDLRGQESRLLGGGPLSIREIAATGAIVVAAGPSPSALPGRPPGADAYFLPEVAAMFSSRTVPPDGRVQFP